MTDDESLIRQFRDANAAWKTNRA